MSEKARALGAAMRSSGPLVTRFLAGFDESNRTRQAPGLPNHAVWTMGHLALTMHRLAEKLGAGPLPDGAFLTGDGRQSDSRRFDTESVGFGSRPADEPAIYPSLARGREIFEEALERAAKAIGALSDVELAKLHAWGKGEMAAEDLATRILFHNGIHAGQLTDLRRAIGLAPIIG